MTAMAEPIQLYMAPGTCARVPSIALEQAGVEFESVVIRFLKGEHKSPEYRALNPKGKVPTLVIDGVTLTENVAILSFLAGRYPEAALLPRTKTDFDRARQIADLSYCASTLHPIVTRIRMPQFFAGPDCVYPVWQAGCQAMTDHFALIDARLAEQPWWYGDEWSAMDGYLYWIHWRCAGAGFDVSPYPNFNEHAARMEQRPAVRRALAREDKAQATLEAEGVAFVPPPPPTPA